jgi:hypothetical protein
MKTDILRVHWFFAVAPLVLAADVYVGLSTRGEMDRYTEAGLLFDFAVLLPALYWLCYRRRGKQALVKVAALACLGIWAALKLVPEAERDLLNHVAFIRYAGLAALAWLEIAVILAIYKTLFKGGSIDEAIARAPADMPAWAVKLLAMEGKLWLKLWGGLKRLLGGK